MVSFIPPQIIFQIDLPFALNSKISSHFSCHSAITIPMFEVDFWRSFYKAFFVTGLRKLHYLLAELCRPSVHSHGMEVEKYLDAHCLGLGRCWWQKKLIQTAFTVVKQIINFFIVPRTKSWFKIESFQNTEWQPKLKIKEIERWKFFKCSRNLDQLSWTIVA